MAGNIEGVSDSGAIVLSGRFLFLQLVTFKLFEKYFNTSTKM